VNGATEPVLQIEELSSHPRLASRLTRRHIVALCRLSDQVGPQGRIEVVDGQRQRVTKSIRIDLTSDPDALVECAKAGLAQLERKFITVTPEVQAALAEWLELPAFSRPVATRR
jgi:hypothetical protein